MSSDTRCACGQVFDTPQQLEDHYMAALEDSDPPTGSEEHRPS